MERKEKILCPKCKKNRRIMDVVINDNSDITIEVKCKQCGSILQIIVKSSGIEISEKVA